jgi:5-methylcytosine-specific restriction enzyme subunit McrC
VRVERLTESRPGILALTGGEADALIRAGRMLASDRTWWGADETDPERTVIQCAPIDRTLWRVTVRDAIGVIVISDALQIHVDPKIALDHFVYLAQAAGTVPRLDDARGLGREATSFWELVAEWYVLATERLVRRDLSRDYEAAVDTLLTQRGTLRTGDTARAFYEGRPSLVCEFDEFSLDTPLNRLIKGAARIVARDTAISDSVRRRARRLVLRMEDTTELRPGDELASVERRTAYYGDAAQLARHVVQHSGRALDSGRDKVWTFLFRTPPIVEEGLRRILQTSLGADRVRRRGIRLNGSSLTLNPDLVMERDGDPIATGDVKYKLATSDWKRGDLYQAVTFATGFRVNDAAICEFHAGGVIRIQPLVVGRVRVVHVGWVSNGELAPKAAAHAFVREFSDWLDSVGQLAEPT